MPSAQPTKLYEDGTDVLARQLDQTLVLMDETFSFEEMYDVKDTVAFILQQQAKKVTGAACGTPCVHAVRVFIVARWHCSSRTSFFTRLCVWVRSVASILVRSSRCLLDYPHLWSVP